MAARPRAVGELEAELAALNELIQSYKLRDEMLERLLDGSTPEGDRRQIEESLRAMRVKVAANRVGLERLHAKSHQLMERSTLLSRQAQEQINRLKR